MANYQRIYITNAGLGATGLSPTFNILKNVGDGTNYTPQPTIEEIGGGWYRFLLDLQPFDHLVAVVDAGSTIADDSERYIPVDIRYSDFDIDDREVYINAVYDEDTDTITFITFLLVNGKILQDNLTSFQLQIYNEGHSLIDTISTSSHSNGVAVLSQNSPSVSANRGFYVIATIVTSNETVVSADSYITLQ